MHDAHRRRQRNTRIVALLITASFIRTAALPLFTL